MLEVCIEHARGLPRTCSRLAKNLLEACQEHARGLPRTCSRLAKNMPEVCQERARGLPRTCSRFAKNMLEASSSAVNLKRIWPRRVSKARAVHAAGVGFFFGGGGGNLAEAAASAVSMQFTAVGLPRTCSRLSHYVVTGDEKVHITCRHIKHTPGHCYSNHTIIPRR